ncbi:hypothetical protein DSO57_1008713 [Entomophthora muscae]|uniref:Uncharacterized protein n=1 Tax=Entomophthora muscae TaxID=34485 RepID=A0ACC2SW76_9FUNG|nr:hypothetical protein DSO57_1008713 [Entomophthora muscae]
MATVNIFSVDMGAVALTSGDQPNSNQYCQNCKQYSHFTSHGKQNYSCCGEEGHPFIYCSTLCAPEARASASEAKPPKTNSSKLKKEANASSAKDEIYLVESLAVVRSNVAQKHCLSQTVHPYSTPGKTKGSKPLKYELANHENPAAGDQPQQQDQHNVPPQEPVAEPYGLQWMKRMSLTMRHLLLKYKSLLLSRLHVATKFPALPANISYNTQGALDKLPLDVSNVMD